MSQPPDQPPSPQPSRRPGLSRLEPVAALLSRIGAELDAFGSGTMRLSRAPGRLDVMGGIADYTGSLVCEGTLDRACAVALSERADRDVQVFSFNLLDEHQPFTLRIPLDALVNNSVDALRAEFNQPGRRWAGYVAGCLFVLHEAGRVDLRQQRGVDIALYSTVPLGAGVSSSAAVEVATMMNLRDHFGIALEPMKLAALCQRVENAVVGAPCGIMDQVTSCLGCEGMLLKLLCQPHELEGFLAVPEGVGFIGINTGVRHSVGGGQYGRTRCAAFMGKRMILEKMAEMGRAAGKLLTGDPMRGYLGNLPLDDYKHWFRGYLPEQMTGREFKEQFGETGDTVTRVDAEVEYNVQGATDHHVHEASRVRNFVGFLEEASKLPARTAERSKLLDLAGHLMYASHVSYTRDALLGADEADLLVELVRKNEREGFYGAKITGGGSGGTVAVMMNDNERARAGIEGIVSAYEKATGKKGEVLWGSSPGAWEAGTQLIT